MKQMIRWMLALTLVLTLTTTAAFATDVDPVWDVLQQILNLQGDPGEADYVLVAVYDELGRMVKAEFATREELQAGLQVTVEKEGLADLCAKVLFMKNEETFQPVAEPQMPEGDKDYTGRKIADGWLVATEDGWLTGDGPAEAGTMRLSDGEQVWTAEAADLGLTKADLGTAFVVEYLSATGEVLSAQPANTAEFVTDEVRNMKAERTIDEYFFTLGERGADARELSFDSDTIPVLSLSEETVKPTEMTARGFYKLISDGAGNTDRYTAIDREDDGDIDWLLHTPVAYGQIRGTGRKQQYGDFVYLKDVLGKDVAVAGQTRLYVAEYLDTEEELSKGDYVKYFWNAALGKLTVERLEKTFDAKYTQYKATTARYTLDDEDYVLAKGCFENAKATLEGVNGQGWDYDIVADGDALVWAARWTNVEELSEHLAVLLKAGDNRVKLLNSSGELVESVYDNDTAAAKNTDDTDVVLTWEELTEMEQLVIVHEGDNGSVWLETIPADAALSIDPLAEAAECAVPLAGTLTAAGDIAWMKKYDIDEGTRLFALIDGEPQVITVEELADGKYAKAEVTALVNGDNIVGGLVKLDTTRYGAITGFLFAEKDTAQGSASARVMTDRAGSVKITLHPDGLTQLENMGIYAYSTTLKGYVISALTQTAAGELTADSKGGLFYDADGIQTALDLTRYDMVGSRDTYWNKTKLVTHTEFCYAEDLTENVSEYGSDYTYSYTAYENPNDGTTVVVVDMEETIDYLDAAALFADGATIDAKAVDGVELLYSLDIMLGDGTNFNPTANVTRAELAKILYVILNGGKDDGAANYRGDLFEGVPASHWYNGYLNYCLTNKILSTPNGMELVSVPECARALLIAIGYSSEVRGYEGDNWENNVLSDAAITGLLEDFCMTTNGLIQRQWLAKMLENALTGAYTASADGSYVLFGEKYLGLTKNSYLWLSVYGK